MAKEDYPEEEQNLEEELQADPTTLLDDDEVSDAEEAFMQGYERDLEEEEEEEKEEENDEFDI